MKITRNLLSALIAAGAPGAAMFALSDRLPADVTLGVLTAISLFAFAICDYSRNTASLQVRAAVIRPPLRAADRPVSGLARKAA